MKSKLLLALLAVAPFSPLAHATVLVVTSLNDTGPGTLRGIISGPLMAGDTIQFAANLSGQSIILTNGEVQLDQNVTIDGSTLPGGIQINGHHNSRIFEVFSGVTATLNALTLTNGYASAGGGILNNGALTLNRCSIVGNTVITGGGGGGIYNNLGILTLNQCTVAGNSASAGGGGIFNLSGGSAVTLNQCTVSRNSAANGGGLGSFNFGVNNVVFFNSIVAGNSGADLDGSTHPVLLGANLIGTDPRLAPLGDYGGPAPTMPPLAGSPALDAGSDSAINSFATDQRGRPRLSGPHVDIGAVEAAHDLMLVVSNTADSGTGSLRQAITEALAGPNAKITFASNLSGETILLTTGEIPLNNSLTIDASALPRGIRIDGNQSSRIFEVASGTTVALTSLYLAGGHPGESDAEGGALKSSGTLTLTGCTLTDNSAIHGGACYNNATLTMTNCTLANNSASFDGGAVGDSLVGHSILTHCTLTRNSATVAGGGIRYVGFLELAGCIVAGNSAPYGSDFNGFGGGPLNSAGGNLIGNTDYSPLAVWRTTDVTGTDALLAPLGNYGGPTPTMPPLPGSPAIDAGLDSVTNSLATDQRGLPRRSGAHVDIGAVEVQIAATPYPLAGLTRLGNGSIQFGFSNLVGGSFSVLASTNLGLPLQSWANLGQALETPPGSGQFQFNDPQATNNPQRFYRVRSP